MAIPTKDSTLVAWGSNFGARVTAAPGDFSLSPAQALAFTTAYDLFVVAFDDLHEAREAGIRSAPLRVAKDTAKAALLSVGRELYGLVQDSLAVSDVKKVEAGVLVPDRDPTRRPIPDQAPGTDITWVNGRTVRVKLHDSVVTSRRGRPPGVEGAYVVSYVGDDVPTTASTWRFEGGTGRLIADIVFPASVPAGAKVWIAAAWFNERKQSGPYSDPISTYLQGGAQAAA